MVNNTWGEERKITPKKMSPSAIICTPPTYLSCTKEKKKIHLLVPQATGGSFLNVSKIPSDPRPEKGIYHSSFYTSIVKQAGI